ncbi:MAG: PilZ domain-containing protein [Acidobacteriia bacterium]|nr:PilZ domain-containing protein [Terriglobia bacterium]
MRLPVNLLIDSAVGEISHPGVTLDMSEGGLRVQTVAALALAQLLGVVFSRHPEPCRVAWVGAAGSRQQGEAGLEFVKPPALPSGPTDLV